MKTLTREETVLITKGAILEAMEAYKGDNILLLMETLNNVDVVLSWFLTSPVEVPEDVYESLVPFIKK